MTMCKFTVCVYSVISTEAYAHALPISGPVLTLLRMDDDSISWEQVTVLQVTCKFYVFALWVKSEVKPASPKVLNFDFFCIYLFIYFLSLKQVRMHFSPHVMSF